MRSVVHKRLLIGWLVLSAITVAFLWLDATAKHRGHPEASTAVTVSAIALALFKVRLIMREFMEVRGAPMLLRRLTDLWIVIMAAAMLGAYFAGRWN